MYWDNSGKLVTDLVGKFPKFKMKDVNLANAAWEWADEGINLSYNYGRADVVQEFPEKAEPFKAISNEIASLVSKHLCVKSFTRVGVRLQYVLPAKDEKESLNLMLETRIVSADAKRIAPFGTDVMEQQLMMRSEDEDSGVIVRVGNQKRDFTSSLPKAFPVDTKRFHPYALVLDVDFYTKKVVPQELLSAADFIRKAEKSSEENLLTLAGLG